MLRAQPLVYIKERSFFIIIKASFSLIRVGQSVRPEWIAHFVNYGMLELSYQFETSYGDSFRSKVQFRKRSNTIFNTRIFVCPF